MMRLRFFTAMVAALCIGALAVMVRPANHVETPRIPQAMAAGNLLNNPGFEGGWTQAALYWTPQGGPYSGIFNEVRGPTGWIAWWREGFPCATAYTFATGRPEVLLFTHPERVHSGAQAVKAFTFWRCHELGLIQQVDVPAGRYVFTVYAHAWYSNCSSKPFDPPLGSDCKTPLAAWDRLKAGIDPAGGVDPHGAGVVWGAEREQYGAYGDPLVVVADMPVTGTVTVFFSSLADNPNKHDDVYLDDAALWRVESTVNLPFIISKD